METATTRIRIRIETECQIPVAICGQVAIGKQNGELRARIETEYLGSVDSTSLLCLTFF